MAMVHAIKLRAQPTSDVFVNMEMESKLCLICSRILLSLGHFNSRETSFHLIMSTISSLSLTMFEQTFNVFRFVFSTILASLLFTASIWLRAFDESSPESCSTREHKSTVVIKSYRINLFNISPAVDDRLRKLFSIIYVPCRIQISLHSSST